MLHGLLKLTWIEMKIFAREPLGLFGTLGMPVIVFVILGRVLGGRSASRPPPPEVARFLAVDLPILAALLVATGAVLSLVTIIAIYREGGILKRLCATPLRPQTILTAHVMAKLVFSSATLLLLAVAGRRFVPAGIDIPLMRFGAALLFTMVCLLSVGFVIASAVPTARFAQPLGTLILYPMIAVSGLFVPIDALPPAVQAVARVVPFTYAVSLLRGAWLREPWSAHLGDIAALIVTFVVCTAVSARIFRWE
jgi:ABC-2 type transport system permease protein